MYRVPKYNVYYIINTKQLRTNQMKPSLNGSLVRSSHVIV